MKHIVFIYGNYCFPKFVGTYEFLSSAASKIREIFSDKDRFVMIESYNAQGNKILDPDHNFCYQINQFIETFGVDSK